MGKLTVWNIVSLDGFFEGTEKWDLRLHGYIWGPDLRQISLDIGEDVDLLVFGRVTYEGMAAHWQDSDDDPDVAAYMNSTPKLVASRTMSEPVWRNTEVTDDIVGELARRKAAGDESMYVFGSAELTDSLLQAGLVDELLVGIARVILGAGTPLFKPVEAPRPLRLLESRPTDTGGVIIRYAVD